MDGLYLRRRKYGADQKKLLKSGYYLKVDSKEAFDKKNTNTLLHKYGISMAKKLGSANHTLPFSAG